MPSSRATIALLAAGLAGLTFAVFGQVRHHGFADLDDLAGIQFNDELEVASLGEALSRAATEPLLSNWMPLTVLSHQLDRKLHGAVAGPQLLGNVALHALSAILLLLALVSMTGCVWRSAFVAAVFAVHPLHVETVAWISERKGALSGVFFMLTLLCYAVYAKRPSGGRYAAVLGSLALALLSKPTTVTTPCVLLLLDAWPLRRLDRRAVLEKLPMFAMVAAACVVTFLVQRATGAMGFGRRIALVDRATNSLIALGTYLRESVWPGGLAPFYAFPLAGPDALASALAGALLLAITVAAWWQWERRPYLLVGWLWFGGMLVPMLGLVQVGSQSHADRYMYLPLTGLSIALAWGVGDLARSPGVRRAVAGAGALAVALLAVGAWHQTRHWRDGWAVWSRVLEVNPGDWQALVALGSLHARELELDRAEAYYLEAFRRDAGRTRGILRHYFRTKATHLRKRGDPEGALDSLRKAVFYDPNHADSLAELGLTLARSGDARQARPFLERAVDLDPGQVDSLLALIADAEAERRYAAAIGYRRQLLSIQPERVSNRNNLAWLLATAPDPAQRDPEEAVALARSLVDASEAPPPNLLDTLAAAQAAAGRFEEAAEVAESARDAARAAGQETLAETIGARLALYRMGRPYREPGEPEESGEPGESAEREPPQS